MREAFADQTDPAFLQEALSQINSYRAQHGAPPLTLDPQLVEYAKSRAAKMSAAGQISHDGLDRQQYGENAAWQATSTPGTPGAAAGATSDWYSEVDNFNFTSPEGPHSGVVGHFTATVWKGSTKVGIGRVAGQGAEYYETFIVANFSPPGNMRGSFAANVSPKQG
ncbi:CAP family protein [Micromonospora lupini]|uniref:CAP family protein n=1 Tax=Micromonospora lupini TaxID=285679 RepID=UPI0033DD1319